MRSPYQMATDVVYFIQAVEGGPVKIGFASRKGLERKIAMLQAGNPSKLRIVGTVPAPDGFQTELEMHVRFGRVRIDSRREWFEPVPAMLEYAPDLIIHRVTLSKIA